MSLKNNFCKNIIDIVVIVIYSLTYIGFIFGLIFNNPILLYILGIVMLFCLFFLIIRPLLNNKRINTFEWLELFISFTAFVVIASIYIACITDDGFRNVVLTLVASALGGLLTLFGVGLTVKYSRLDKKDDELSRLKPLVFPISQETWHATSNEKINTVNVEINNEWSDIKNVPKNKSNYCFAPILLANSDVSISVFSGIIINDKIIKFKYELVLTKNSFNAIIVDLHFKLDEEITSIDLILEDVMRNQYYANMNYDIKSDSKKKKSEIIIKAIFDTYILQLDSN